MEYHLLIIGETRDVVIGEMKSCRASSRFVEKSMGGERDECLPDL